MPILLKTSIKKTYAEALLNDISLNRNQYFLFIGKTTPWDATIGASADIVPVVPANTDADEYDTMRGIIAYKKLDPSKIVFALPRNEWSNRIFDAYQDDIDIFSTTSPKIFYTTTLSNNIYKCIDVPFPPSTIKSTVEPTHTTSTAVRYSDGYTWKYLATVKESLLPYELVDYLPVSFVKAQQDALGIDNETTLQFNTQKSAVDGELTRVEMLDSVAVLTGASAALYTSSEYGERFRVGATGSTASNSSFGLGDLYSITSSTQTNRFNVSVADINNYVGYALRIVGVSGTGTNPSDINKYGIIQGVTANTQQYSFSIRGEYDPFSIAYTDSTTQEIFFDILPYAKISGDGSRATAFPIVGKTGEASWRKITGIALVNNGKQYTQATVNIVSPKSDGGSLNTIHPRIKAELSPKGGHGSNILKELGVKDVILIAQLDSFDEDIAPIGGSYRKFGIIKNPILNDGSGIVAGTDSVYFTDLILQYIGTSALTTIANFQTAFFPTSGATANLIIGTESNAAFPVVAVKNVIVGNGETRVQVKVRSNQTAPITWADRLTNYEISLSPAKSGFLVGETVTENIPAGVNVSGISYAFGITAEGTITKASTTKLRVNVTSNAFVGGAGREVLGQYSGVTAAVAGVSLGYGETVYVNKGFSFATEGLTAELFRIISASPAYFEEASVPSYTGLTILTVTQPSPALASLTDTTWISGAFIQQGVSASYNNDYASGTVYKWERTDSSNGTLYLTEPFGVFKSTTTAGVTFGRLNGGTINGGYAVSAITPPQIEIHSGEIIYINSIQPIQRVSNQTDEFRLRVGF